MKPSQFMLAYKDSPKAHVMLFGPFIDTRTASEFSEAIPDPQPGGYKRYMVTQPFSVNDTKIVSDLIELKRKQTA